MCSRRVATLLVVASLLALSGCGGSASTGFASTDGAAVPIDMTADEFSFANFSAKKSPEEFGTADVVGMFGDSTDVCASGQGDTCELTAEAATWARMVNQARQTGHCEGFAVMASARFAQNASPSTNELVNEGDVTHGIMRGFATQFERAVKDETDDWARKSVGDKVLAIDNALAQGNLEFVLGVYTKSGGHAVLPWKVEYLDGDTARIHVYDSNWPGHDRYVTAHAKKNSWEFSFRGKDPANDPDQWTGGAADMDLASMKSRADGSCPFCEGASRVKSSLFVIRATALDWNVSTQQGRLGPDNRLTSDDSARPLKADGGNGYDYLVNLNETEPVTFDLPSVAHITGVTSGAAVEVQTSGTATSHVTIGESTIESTDPGTTVTLAAGDFVATANGADARIETTQTGLDVQVTASTGQVINFTVNEDSPAVEIRTQGSENLTAGVYQVVVQTGQNEITTTTVSATGRQTVEVNAGELSNTGTEVKLPAVLDAPVEDPDLPSVEDRSGEAPATTTTTTTSSTSTTTVPTTTTTVRTTTTTTTTPSSTSTTTSSTSTTTTTLPVTTPTVPAFTPWVQNVSAASNDQFQQIVTDSAGFVYGTGYFCGASMTVGSTTLTNVGTPGSTCEMFVEKIASNGTVQWVKRAGGTAQDFPQSIAVDNSGNVWVTLAFESTFSFGSGNVTYQKVSGGQLALLKFNSAGTPQWGLAMNPIISSADVAAGASVYVTAQIPSGQAVVQFFGQSVSSNGQTGAMVTRVDPATAAGAWGFMIQGSGSQWFGDTVVDSSGNLAVTGYFDGANLSVRSSTAANSAPGNDEIFVVKFDSTGTVVMAKSAGGAGMDEGGFIAARSDGSVYVSMSTDSTSLTFATNTAFGGTVAQGVTRTGVLRISSSGALQSAKLFTANDIAQVGGLAVSSTGDVFIAGTYSAAALTFGNATVPNPNGDVQVFYVGWDTNGNILAAGSAGGAGTEYMQGGNGCAFDAGGHPVLAFDSWAPSIVIGSHTYMNQDLDAFLVFTNTSLALP